jgi:hypothetical protein
LTHFSDGGSKGPEGVKKDKDGKGDKDDADGKGKSFPPKGGECSVLNGIPHQTFAPN